MKKMIFFFVFLLGTVLAGAPLTAEKELTQMPLLKWRGTVASASKGSFKSPAGRETVCFTYPILYDANGKMTSGFIYYDKYHNNTDWADLVYREAVTQNYKINVEGGDDVAMYNFSFGYTLSDSPLKGNNFDRLNIRLNSDVVLADNFKTRFDISYAKVGRELLDDGVREDQTAFPVSSVGVLAAIKSPFLSPYRFATTGEISSILDVADNFAFDVVKASGVAYPNNSYYNPMTILSKGSATQKNELEYTNMGITVAPEYVLGDFKITETFNYSLHRVSEKYYLPYPTSSENAYYHFYVPSLNGRIGNFISSFFGKEASLLSDTRVE
jgi:hypothetical protein